MQRGALASVQSVTHLTPLHLPFNPQNHAFVPRTSTNRSRISSNFVGFRRISSENDAKTSDFVGKRPLIDLARGSKAPKQAPIARFLHRFVQ